MNYMRGAIDALRVTLENFLRAPVTESVRSHELRAPRYRASFALTHDQHGEEACIGCKLCDKICPSQVITVVAGPKVVSEATGKKRGTAADFTLDLQACIYCELCVQVCPTDSIVMRREQELPAFSRDGLVLTMARLYANEQGLPATWGTGKLLQEMQDPKRGQPKRERKPRPKPAPKPKAAPKPEDAAATELSVPPSEEGTP